MFYIENVYVIVGNGNLFVHKIIAQIYDVLYIAV